MAQNRFQNFWNDPGPDTGWSWVILATTWIYFAMTVGFRFTGSGAIYFIEFSSVFHVTRTEAAWPFAVIGITSCISGLFVGVINNCFDLRLLMLSCAILMAYALSMCFLAPGLLYISLFFGILIGFVTPIIYTGCIVYICQYFKKHLATATGVLTTALPLAGSFIPYLLNYLIEQYGLRGSMLLYGGLLLNLVAVALLMRPRTSRHYPGLVARQQNHALLEISSSSIKKPQRPLSKGRQLREGLHTYRNVITKTMFYVITASLVISTNNLMGVSMILLDFALDSGLTKDEGLLLLTIFSFADVFGRLGVGCVADRGWLSKEQLVMTASFLMAVSLLLIGLRQQSPWIMAMTTLVGIGEGGVSSIANVLYPKYLGDENTSTALGLRGVYVGLISFFTPFLIGYLRGALQTHFYSFCIMGLLALVSGLIWLPTICSAKKLEKVNTNTVCVRDTEENCRFNEESL